MTLKIRHLLLMLFLIVAASCVVSGQQRPNLIIGGIWQTSEDQATNQKYADALDAEYVHTYYSLTKNPYAYDETTITGKLLADINTNERLAYDAAAKTADVWAVKQATPVQDNHYWAGVVPKVEKPATTEGTVYRNIRDPSGAIVAYASYDSNKLNGLTDERLNPSEDGTGKHYDTIYAHSGGARTAVTALLYQGVTADRLVLISPARGTQDQKDYNKDLQQLLKSGKVGKIDVYQSESDKNGNPYDNPTAAGLWQGRFEEGDVKGNFEIIPVTYIELLGKTGNAGHIQMWESALCKDSETIQDLVYPATPAPDQVSRSYAVIADEPSDTIETPGSAPADSLLVGTPQSPVIWLETSPIDTSQSNTNTQGTAQTTSQSPSAKFPVGAKVWVTTALGLHVRSVPGDLTNDPAIPLEAKGSLGTIQEGRVYANGFHWVKIKYDDGKTGWSAENWLELAPINTEKAKAPANTEKANTQSESASEDNKPPIPLQVDQPVTPAYTSQIPVEGTQTKHWSTANTPPGKVALSLDIRDKNGNIVPAGTKVTVKDGSGNYVQVDWSSTGQTLAFGAPGYWTITVDAPGYKTNTQYVEVSSASSSTSFRMNLQENGINIQPPASASKLAQAGIGTPLLLPPTSDMSSDASSYGPFSSGIGKPLIEGQGTSPSQSGTGDITNDVNITVGAIDP